MCYLYIRTIQAKSDLRIGVSRCFLFVYGLSLTTKI